MGARKFRLKKIDILLICGIFIGIVLLVVLFVNLFYFDANVILPEFEANEITSDVPVQAYDLGYTAVGDETMSFMAYICGMPEVSDGGLDVYFMNPEDNDAWLLLQVLDSEGKVVSQSGLLYPGCYLKSIPGKFACKICAS